MIMRWPFAKDEVDPLRETEGDTEPVIETHRSPGLEVALSHLHEERTCNILDLGPAVATNIDFFSRYPCRLHIVDLLCRIATESDSALRLEEEPKAYFLEMLSTEIEHFDLVLAWTVFDHLEKEAACHLASLLARRTIRGGRLYAIGATAYRAGGRALSFSISGPDTLQYCPTGRQDRHSSALNPAAVAKRLEGFAIDESVVLRHGFREYVAVRLEDVNKEVLGANRPAVIPRQK